MLLFCADYGLQFLLAHLLDWWRRLRLEPILNIPRHLLAVALLGIMQQLPLAKGIPLFEERAITAPPLHIVFTHAAAILALAHLFLGVGGVWFLNFDPFIFTVTFLGLILFGRGRLARQARRMLPVHYALFVRDEEI